MDNELTTLEQMLRAKAGEVSSLQAPPRAMLMRARRRVARNAIASVLSVGLLVVGASAGLASLRAQNRPVPGGGGGVTSPTPGFSASACTAADLRATATLQGAAGSTVGSIRFANASSKTCTLTGRPAITLHSSTGQVLAVQATDAGPWWRVDKFPQPSGWPVVEVRPGDAADVRVRWSNECPQLSDPPLWTVSVSGGSLDVSGTGGIYPPCNGSAVPSTLEIGPFEPSPAGVR